MKCLITLYILCLQLVFSNVIHYHYYGDMGRSLANSTTPKHLGWRRVKIICAHVHGYLSHGNSKISNARTFVGEGEIWKIHD